MGRQALLVLGGTVPARIGVSTPASGTEADSAEELLFLDAEARWSFRQEDMRGRRCALTAFQHPTREHLTPGASGYLKAMGFVLDNPAALKPPVRVSLAEAHGKAAPAFYVGRRGAVDEWSPSR